MIFIGPSWKPFASFGDKINTKRLARSLGVPIVPGSDRPIYDEMEAEHIAKSVFEFQEGQGIERPWFMVKASAGGGGMGNWRKFTILTSSVRFTAGFAIMPLRQFKRRGRFD